MKCMSARLKRLLYPPKWARLLVSPIVFAALAFVLYSGRNDSVPAYLLYGMSAYCLVVCLLPMPKQVRSAREAAVQRIRRTAFGDRYLSDPVFRGGVSLWQGMLANLLYVAFRTVVGIRHASVWSFSVAAYYLALAILRLSLILGYRHRAEIDELRCYRRTAWLLLLLMLPMGGMIVLMVRTNAGYSYPGYVIYLSAAYTFYTVTEAAVRLVRLRRLGSPILSAAKAVSLIAALMSVLGLQTAMIAQFSVRGDGFRKTMNAITGGTVWLCVMLTAACMLRKCAKRREEGKALESIRK